MERLNHPAQIRMRPEMVEKLRRWSGANEGGHGESAEPRIDSSVSTGNWSHRAERANGFGGR